MTGSTCKRRSGGRGKGRFQVALGHGLWFHGTRFDMHFKAGAFIFTAGHFIFKIILVIVAMDKRFIHRL